LFYYFIAQTDFQKDQTRVEVKVNKVRHRGFNFMEIINLSNQGDYAYN